MQPPKRSDTHKKKYDKYANNHILERNKERKKIKRENEILKRKIKKEKI